MSEILTTKEDLLDKLRAYANNPDDDNIKYKDIIKKALLNCPELLCALNNKELESELFDEDGNLLIDKDTGELLGEVDRYFGDNSNIRPSLFNAYNNSALFNRASRIFSLYRMLSSSGVSA